MHRCGVSQFKNTPIGVSGYWFSSSSVYLSPRQAPLVSTGKGGKHPCCGMKQSVTMETHRDYLIGGFNPSEKYARQIGNLPQIGVNIKKYLKPPASYSMLY